ncbi:MAG: hypothetical protein KGJ88_01005 [Verrucomicrobiota bacterium]|nr:hypothetical protein [Verrucomicrobiota bacterium]
MHANGHLTAVGWTTCGLYFIAAAAAWHAAVISRGHAPAGAARIWAWLGVLLAALGVNKVIDAQTLLIEAGRRLARKENVYKYHRGLERLFFGVLALILVTLLATWIFRRRGRVANFIRGLPGLAAGCGLILIYILLRAASIEHIDAWMGVNFEAIPFLWLLEAGGLGLIIVNAAVQKR